MKLLHEAKRRALGLFSPKSLLLTLLAGVLAMVPGLAMAASGEANVVLNFTDSDKIYLYISLGLGVIALVVAFMLSKSVLSMSAGSEKMQEVGLAIREGALAYLQRQVKTMAIFVVLLAVLLFFMFMPDYGTGLSIAVAVAFIAGVAASYIAGYTGMLMAVAGNMRTANAALSSYKKSLEVAFRSGAVAGMVTVGMGLIGATLIFLLFSADAMKLLVGFGFGGSLAALFMRVGGGIFTKAADVGADLVGKVEAGIPEDDPRNPATIADNVGDNVGDCAGMAADVFESYEVTLVAAIILGAATASIFDQSTWMKLILFALMARGVGILASIIGIYSVKGSDDLDSDPLKPIRRGFWTSAAVAALGTVVLAFFMMGGTGDKITTGQLVGQSEAFKEAILAVQSARADIASDKKLPDWKVSIEDLKAHPSVKELKIPEANAIQLIQQSAQVRSEDLNAVTGLEGYKRVGPGSPVLNYTVRKQDQMGQAPVQYLKLGEALKDIRVVKIERESPPDPTGAAPTKQNAWVITTNPEEAAQQGGKVVGDPKGVPAHLYANAAGDLVIGAPTDSKYEFFFGNQNALRDPIFKISEADIKASADAQEKLIKDYQAVQTKIGTATGDAKTKLEADAKKILDQYQTLPQPNPVAVQVAVVENKQVPWYMFAIAILFGIGMAFAIEILTDYYVSTHKKPVQEVAGVSTAGPAPMIIQGFALASESSVFSVFAIVVALIAPLVFFPPDLYGGYILSFYGIALVGLGLLTTTGYILAMDTFGPISDNAQGVFEMSGAGHESATGSKAVQRLDAAGNTTKALTKGFAIATAVVAAVALFHSYVEDAQLTAMGMRLEIPEIFLGLLIGGAAPYLFAAFSINAVGRASFQLINEVRRQFREDAGIMAGTSKPNYARCVAIVTQAAQTELIGPAILAIALPAAVGFGFSIGKPTTVIGGQEYNLVGAQALGGFLAGAILSGQLMAVLLANSGGMWDNAKKLIEDGLFGGKGSEAHKAGVVCDTVGDPFKDTAGPAMNPLIKVMNLVALLIAVQVIKPLPDSALIAITVVCLAALAFSIWWSKRGSMSSALTAAAEEASHTPLAQTDDALLPGRTETHGTTGDTRKRITVDDDEENS